MEIRFTLQLPRDALSVPVVRRVLTSSMTTLGVEPTCIDDIQVALTEAVTNVLDHAASDDEYEVIAGINDDVCVIQIVDAGRGFDADSLGHAEADPNAEEGRGIQLMRALVDQVKFQSRPEAGMVVHLEKSLQFRDGAPIQQLAERTQTEIAIDLVSAEETLRESNEALEEVAGD